MLFALGLLLVSATAPACTSFAICEGTNIVVGNNDDWFSVSAYLVVNKRSITKKGFLSSTNAPPLEWTSRYGSVTVDFNAIGIPSAGMNEAGLVVDELYPGGPMQYEPPDDRPIIDEIQWIQYQLDNCATVQEVGKTDEIIRVVPYYWHSHYFVYDRNGNAAVIRFTDGKMDAQVIPPGGVQVLANRPYSEALDKCEKQPATNEYRRVNGRMSSADRFCVAAKMVRAYSAGTNATPPADYAFQVLASVSQASTGISWVYDPINLRIHYKTAVDGKTRTVTLGKFGFDGRTPMLLVDLMTDKAGDISGDFVPYQPEKSRELVWRTIKDWRAHKFALHITDAEVERLIQYPETMTFAASTNAPHRVNE